MEVSPGRVRLDVGRLIMVPAFGAIVVADAFALGRHGPSGAEGLLRSIGAVLVLASYALAIWCYLRRGPAVATSGSKTAHAAAIIATWVPFTLPLLHGPVPGLGHQALADALVACGTAWALWSLRSLGPNVSVIPQARNVADRGPYRWVRHPLYVGEMVSSLGVALAANSDAAIGLWLAMCALQVYRATREEQVLLQALPAYRSYRSRTAALLPGVF